MGKSVFIFLLKLYLGSHPLLSIRGAAGGFGFCVLPEWHPFLGGGGACRRWGDDNAPQGEYPEGMAPSGRFFGDFLIGEKVTRVQGGAPASREERRGGPQPSSQSASAYR